LLLLLLLLWRAIAPPAWAAVPCVVPWRLPDGPPVGGGTLAVLAALDLNPLVLLLLVALVLLLLRGLRRF